MMTDKKNWGGKRPNQTGRPTNRKGVKRVSLHCLVDPTTKDQIKRISELKKLSAGQIIDEWAEGSKKGKL
tara:strand:+ start:770 stop:979 length:210 start_codon:yes stop_codon:yes gene_type:complete